MTPARRRFAVTLIAAACLLTGCGTHHAGAGGQPGGASPGGSQPAGQSGTSGGSPSSTPTAFGTGAAGSKCPGASGQYPTATSQAQLNSVQFVSADTGWVVGSGRILNTTNAGQSWVTQYRTSAAARLTSLDFIDGAHGWVVGASSLLATIDGGARWYRLPEPCPLIRAVHFISPRVGFAVAGGTTPEPPYAGSDGGVLLKTANGGVSWSELAAPPSAQSVCFTSARHGWLGADGRIYGTSDGGQAWTLAVRDPFATQGLHSLATVQCAGPSAAWATIVGPGAAMNHQPWAGLHTYGGRWSPLFAELYMPHTALSRVHTDSPGPYSGPLSSISPDQAVFVGYCAPCSAPPGSSLEGSTPLYLASNGGTRLVLRNDIADLSQANGAAFLSLADGWAVGTAITFPTSAKRSVTIGRIMHTTDGGRSWQVQYQT